MSKVLLTVTITLTLLCQPVMAASFGKDRPHEPTTNSRIEIPVETNVRLGGIRLDSEFPNGKNNIKPDPKETVVPELQKEICVGADCRCGDTGEK